MTFKFRRDKSNLPHSKFKATDDVLVHLSIDNYEPDLMKISDEDPEEYLITRMVPPKPIQYYFSVKDVARYRVDLENDAASTEKYIELNNVLEQGNSIPWRVNISPLPAQNIMQIDLKYLEEIGCRPRPNIYIPKVEEEEKQRPKWTQEESVFKNYKIDHSQILEKCFEFDWNCSKIPNMLKDRPIKPQVFSTPADQNPDPSETLSDAVKIKQFLKENYRLMRECYRYYAGINPCGIVPCIGQNSFNEIVNTTGMIDSKELNLSDIDFEFIVTKSGTDKSAFNPERWLIRYQFMEIFIRIALHKFWKSKIVDR